MYTEGKEVYDGAIPNEDHPIGSFLKKKYGDKIFDTNYSGREENFVVNPNAKIIAKMNVNLQGGEDKLVAAYEMPYGKGSVIHSGIFGSLIINEDEAFQDFLIESIRQYKHTN